MEFQNLGEHCSYSYCRQLDYLPFQCEGCLQKFCKDHRRSVDHECEVPENHGVTLNDSDITLTQPKKERCWGCRKKLTSINTTTCQTCLIPVCFTHRFPDDHRCIGRPVSKLIRANNYNGGDSLVQNQHEVENTKIVQEPELKILPVEDASNEFVTENKCPI